MESFWIERTVFGLFGQFLGCRQFLGCLDSFWIIQTIYGFPDISWVVWIVFRLSGQFLDYQEIFWVVRTFLDTQVSLAPTHVSLSVGWSVTLSVFQSLVALSEK